MRTLKLKDISIDDFNMDVRLLTIYWHTPATDNQRTEICRRCIEDWLAETGRLDWCEDNEDTGGTHLQHTGTLAAEDYWQYVDYETKTKDLGAFLKLHLADEEKH